MPGEAAYDARQILSPTSMDGTWVMRTNNPPEQTAVRKVGEQWFGTYLASGTGDWTSCAWSPPAVYVPKLVPGTTASIDSRCENEFPPGSGRHDRVHVVGTVNVVGTRTVRYKDTPYTVWILQREWQETTKREDGSHVGASSSKGEMWWSPDLQAVVRLAAESTSDYKVDGKFLTYSYVTRLVFTVWE